MYSVFTVGRPGSSLLWGLFSGRSAWLLTARASLVSEQGLSGRGSRVPQHRLSGCAPWAELLGGTRDLPGPGIEPVSPACPGRFFATEPARKPPASSLSEHLVLFSA